MSTVPDVPGPGTGTALLAAVAIYTAGMSSHLSDQWRGIFIAFAAAALIFTTAIEYWHTH